MNGMVNSVDPDQTAPLGLQCLPRPICPKTGTLRYILLHKNMLWYSLESNEYEYPHHVIMEN